MSLIDLDIKDSYRSDDCPDIGKCFVSKMLEQSVIYKRAVGFFSSSCLIKLSYGISKLISRPNSHIYLIASPFLSTEDVEAIKLGYKKRNEIIEGSLLRELKEPKNEFEEERLNFLCHLIEDGILDIKIADKFSDTSDVGMFHEKIGLFIDEDGNKVAFSGSLNESDNAFSHNFESIQVFKSWEEPRRVNIISDDFDRLWEDKTNSLTICDFPEAVRKALFKYYKLTYQKDPDEYEARKKTEALIAQVQTKPKYNCPFPPYQYQKDAIQKWANQGFRGLFDMGTGTGKTITALYADTILLKKLNYRMATIIVCPYTHLVEQWVDEESHFNIKFIVGYSDGKYKDYLSKLNQAIQDFNDRVIDYFFFVTTNASYKTEKVQKALSSIKGNVLFIADEVHNFGADGMQSSLIESFKYRIGLSATIDRHRDEEGTNAIYEYFGNPVIHYGLKEAIQNDVLTRYFYYPIKVFLTEDELEKYIEITAKIRKNSFVSEDKVKLTKEGERLALQRARIVATAYNKLGVLKELMKDYVDDHNILVYCGTGKISGGVDGGEVKQIDEVCKILGNELGMKIARYTSRENPEERKIITERYKSGDDLQAVVAIKCLDEGVNIPSIKTAFILASSTNPREYIQRRGRVLRKFPGKKYSYIYDFVTLPVDLNKVGDYSEEFLKNFRTLAKNEIDRIKEFSSLAENEHESDDVINEITDAFGLNNFEINDDFEKIDWEEIDYGE